MVITGTESRDDLAETLHHLAHRAGRMTVVAPEYADLHAEINDMLTAYLAAR